MAAPLPELAIDDNLLFDRKWTVNLKLKSSASTLESGHERLTSPLPSPPYSLPKLLTADHPNPPFRGLHPAEKHWSSFTFGR